MSTDALRAEILPLLELLYPGRADAVADEVVALTRGRSGPGRPRPSESTTFLITYGDAIRRPDETPLHTLGEVLREHVGDVISDVHLLPMFPWTSDDGFAVVDHRRVNPALGTWEDIAGLASDHWLMFDFVANHVSASSPWFLGWRSGDPTFNGYFVDHDPGFDTSKVVRPRVLPLHHEYDRADGTRASVWTTFGPDQVDVAVANPRVLLDLTDVLLGYLERGASSIRLDAIGFLWKESGTTCLHLPQTHAVVKLWRALVDHVAPGTLLLTETNVPHEENISYFGDGTDEAHLVYQFALPPLVLHSFVSGSTATLSTWASGIGPVSPSATWLNFLASHDGIGLRPTEGILDDAERQALVDRTLAHGGRVSMAAPADGRETVYELNINYLEALVSPQEAEQDEVVAAKALAAHSILLAFLGVPAVYYHSLFGSRPDHDGMRASGINRRINREMLDADDLIEQLSHDPRRRLIFDGLANMLRTRREQPSFSPYGEQRVEVVDDRVFALRRGPSTPGELVCVTNVTDQPIVLEGISGTDVITGADARPLRLAPYGYAWVRPGSA